MKKILITLLSCFILSAVQGEDQVRLALYGALEQAASELRNSTAVFRGQTIAILPLPGPHSYLIGKLKNIVTAAGLKCVEANKDPIWSTLINEIAWAERQNDILDPKTVAKFGKLKAAQILLQGRILTLDQTADRIYAEIELHATEISTNQHIWGGLFAFRHYTGKDVQGLLSLDENLTQLLKKNFSVAGESLKSPEFKSRIGNIKTVTVVPLAGDIDRFMTGLTIEMLAHTKLLPKNPRIPSVSLARAYARDKKQGSDAILYGAVRDLRRTPLTPVIKKNKVIDRYTVSATIQLVLEDPVTGNIPWTKVIQLSDQVAQERVQSEQEVRKFQREEQIKKILLIVGGILALFVLIKILRVKNNVR